MCVVTVVVGVVAPPARSQAADTHVLFVAPGGTDGANHCGAPATASASVGHALSEATSGDVIHVAAGTYHEHGLVATIAVEIDGTGASATVIDADHMGQAVLVDTGASLTLGGVTIENGKSPAHRRARWRTAGRWP